MCLEDIMLREINQTEKQILYDLTHMWNVKKAIEKAQLCAYQKQGLGVGRRCLKGTASRGTMTSC